MKLLDAFDSIFHDIGNTVAISLFLIALVMPALKPIMLVLLPIVFILGTIYYARQKKTWLAVIYGIFSLAILIFDGLQLLH